MTGIEKIVAKIREDADAEYRRVVDEAVTQADAVLTEAAAEAKAHAAQVIADAEAQSAEIERRAVSMAGLEVRKMRLDTKQKLLQQAFDRALSDLTSLPDAEYQKLLVSLAAASADDGAVLVFSEKDREKYGAAVVKEVNALLSSKGRTVSLSPDTRDMPGGVIVCNGRVEINCAFDTLINDQREELAADIAKILF